MVGEFSAIIIDNSLSSLFSLSTSSFPPIAGFPLHSDSHLSEQWHFEAVYILELRIGKE